MVQRQHRPGDRLPADVDLAQMLGVARSTVIAALDRLEAAGVIMRRQGSGTFVREVPLPAGARHGIEVFEPYARSAERQGISLTVGDVQVAPATPVSAAIANALALGPGTPCTRINAVMVGGGEPRALSIDTIHPDVELPDREELTLRLRGGESVLDILVGAGVAVAYGQTSLRARLLQPGEPAGMALRLTGAVAAMELTETTHLASGAAVRHAVDILLPGALNLQVFRQMDLRHAERPRSIPRSGVASE